MDRRDGKIERIRFRVSAWNFFAISRQLITLSCFGHFWIWDWPICRKRSFMPIEKGSPQDISDAASRVQWEGDGSPTPTRSAMHGFDAIRNWNSGEMQPGTKPDQSLNGTERSIAQPGK